MTGFWLAAAALIATAVAFLLVPAVLHRQRSGRWPWTAIVAAAVTAPVAVVLYFQVSNWNPELAGRAAEGTRLVRQLAERMRENPADPRGWSLLGNAYMSLGEYVQARAAFAEAWQRSTVRDDELKVSYAESLVLTQAGALTGEAGRLFEEVLASDPRNPKALWYGGLAAVETGRPSAAMERWTRMLELQLPEQVHEVVRMQLAQLARGPGPAEPAGTGTAEAGPELRLRVRLGAAAATQSFGPDAALFLFARSPGGGPPLAVRREPAGAVPGEFVLSNANAMLPGTSLGDFPELTIIARLSPSGQPTEQAGDWYVEAQVDPDAEGIIDLVIDRVVQ